MRIESARFQENEIRHERTTASPECSLCACVSRVKRGTEVQGTRGNGEEFLRVSRVSAGKSTIPPSRSREARIIREFLEKEGS